MLRNLRLAPSYDKGIDDIATAFYLPCMRVATAYDRISGYFSSAIFSLAWPALKEFVKAGGRMRIICSPILSGGDVGGLREGYASLSDSDLADALVAELRVLLESDHSRKPARVLAGLITVGVVDLQVAILSDGASAADRRLFHDKVGVFVDREGDAVGFRGSMNETYLGLAADGNLESIDVFPSWEGGRDTARLNSARERFDALWQHRASGVSVREFPEPALSVLREASAEDWEVLIDEVVAEATVRAATPVTARPLRDHQVQALAAWELNGRQGLLEHATGSGKTYTAITAIRTAIVEGGSALVLVPSEILFNQWQQELTSNLADLEPKVLRCGSGHNEWRQENLLRLWTSPSASGARIVLATMPTAASEAFRQGAFIGDKLLVVADEAHRLGSPHHQELLSLEAPWRLGLSATPTRAGDPTGTRAILDYFKGVLQPPYTLTDAINDRVLTPYEYYPHEVPLASDEQAQYLELSRRIRREAGRQKDALDDVEANERLRKLAIERARLLKRAKAKVSLAVRVLSEHYHPGQRWLVYCDGISQLRQIRAAAQESGIDTLEYHSGMVGDRRGTLAELELNGGILVSVRCLDEGVDLPAVTHALVLASSRNPREFIQRRGRILRRHRAKALAYLHDAVVVPSLQKQSGEQESPDHRRAGDRLLAGELGRVSEFAEGAANPQCLTVVEQLCIRHGVSVGINRRPIDQAAGVESEEDGEDD